MTNTTRNTIMQDLWETHYPKLKALAGRGSDHKDPVKNKGTWCVWKLYREVSELTNDRLQERLLSYAKDHGLKYETGPAVVRVLIPWPEGGTKQEQGKRAYREKKRAKRNKL